MTFSYHEPTTWVAAHELIAREPEATVLAGGTAFMLMLRQGLIRPSSVVSLRRVPEATAIRADAHGGLSIGAMATHTAVVMSPLVRKTWPEFAEAAAKVATLRIRNQATIGGSVAHADPASDVPVMLAALGAQALVRSGAGTRRVPIDELLVDTFTTSLAADELIQSIEIPARGRYTRAVYLKFTLRSVDDYATVSVAARADIAQGYVNAPRIFLGAVGPRPMRARSVESAIVEDSKDPRPDAEALVRSDIDPIDDIRGSAEYKREMARVLTRRALRALYA